MSVDTTMAVLYAQSGLSTNVANAAMVAPQAAMAMSRVLAAEAARQEREQVEKSEKAAKSQIQGKGGGNRFFHTRRRLRAPGAPEAEAPLATTPVIGNLLNVKV